MRAVVLGSWGIGECVLRAALETEGVEVVAVFTRPRDPDSNDPFRNLVADLAATNGVPVYPPRASAGAEGISQMKALRPDVMLSAAHPLLFSSELLSVPRSGALNLHGSLLPLHRGTSPVNWALIRDESETGLTLHFIDAGMDTGDVIFQEKVPITDEDTPGSLSDSIKAFAPELIQRALRVLLSGEALPRIPQDDSRASYSPRLKGDDLFIDWNRPSRSVWSFVRGTSQPGLGARARFDGSEITIWSSREEAATAGGKNRGEVAARPGTVVASDETTIQVQCSPGILNIPRKSIQAGTGLTAKLAVGTVLGREGN